MITRCGLAWDKARLARQGWEGEKVVFLSILRKYSAHAPDVLAIEVLLC